MKVLVTGATGFLGSHLVHRLRGMDLDVYGVGRDARQGAELEKVGAHFLRADISQAGSHELWPKKIDWVVHCAALSSPWGREEEFRLANVEATRNLINYAQTVDCQRFVHISSPSIYVDRFDKWDVDEDDPLPEIQLNHYIATKRMAEDEVDAAVYRGLPAITLRPQGIIGKGDRSIFPRILKAAKRGMVPRIGPGETHTDLTHVSNVVESIVCALNAPKNRVGRKYNITNGQPVEIYGVIENLLKVLNIQYRWKNLSLKKAYRIGAAMEWVSRNLLAYREPLLTRYTACALGASRTLKITRAQRELGYNPQVDIHEAMEVFAQDLKENGGHV